MKGAPGIVIALILGLLAAVLNWVYLESKTRDVDSVAFLGIAAERIEPGHVFQRSDFVPEGVKIPRRNAGDLKKFVFLHEDLDTIVGTSATRRYEAGQFFYREDYITPSPELVLEKDEILFWVSVDPRAVVSELIVPGDKLSFHFPNLTASVLRPPEPVGGDVGDGGELAPLPAAPLGPTSIETIGPFRVKTLGNRMGRVEVMRAGRRSPSQEQKIGIVIDQTDPEELARFDKLRERVLTGDYRNVGVSLHSRK